MRLPAKEHAILSFFETLLFAIGACDASEGNQDLGQELETVYNDLEQAGHAQHLADNAVLRAQGAASKKWVKAKKTNRAFHKAEAAYIAADAPKSYKPIFTSTPAQMEHLAETERQAEFERVAEAATGLLPPLMKPAGKNVKAAVDAWVAAEANLATAEKARLKADVAVEDAKVVAITALQKFSGDLHSRYPGDREEQESYAKPVPRKPSVPATPAKPETTADKKEEKPAPAEKTAPATTPPEEKAQPPEPPPGPIAAGEGAPKAPPQTSAAQSAPAPGPITTITYAETTSTTAPPRKS